jgi:hypothetical protein
MIFLRILILNAFLIALFIWAIGFMEIPDSNGEVDYTGEW